MLNPSGGDLDQLSWSKPVTLYACLYTVRLRNNGPASDSVVGLDTDLRYLGEVSHFRSQVEPRDDYQIDGRSVDQYFNVAPALREVLPRLLIQLGPKDGFDPSSWSRTWRGPLIKRIRPFDLPYLLISS